MDPIVIVLGLVVVAVLALAGLYFVGSRGGAVTGPAAGTAAPPPPPPAVPETHVPEEALSAERTFAAREQWRQIPTGELRSPDLIDGAGRTTGPIEAYRVPGRMGDYEEEMELLWFLSTGRAAVAYAGRSFWTNARSPESALRAWANGRASGVRTAPR
jgi:hypothetical protein